MMQRDDEPQLKVVVHDEVIDLRKELFDQDEYVPRSFNFGAMPPQLRPGLEVPPFSKNKLSGSEPTLQKKKRRIPVPRDLPSRARHKDLPKYRGSDMSDISSSRKEILTAPSANLTRLAENLSHNGPSSFTTVSSNVTVPSKPTIIRNKPILRSKLPKTRATSADPRFRRTRSPSSRNHTLVTQSESRVSPNNSERKASSQSDSKFIVDRNHNATDQSGAGGASVGPQEPIGAQQQSGDSPHVRTKRQPVEESLDEVTEKTTSASEKTVIEKDKSGGEPTPAASADEDPSLSAMSISQCLVVDPTVFNVPLIGDEAMGMKHVDVYNASMTKTVKLYDHADRKNQDL